MLNCGAIICSITVTRQVNIREEKNSGKTSETPTPTLSSVRIFNIVECSEQYQTDSLPLVDFFKFLQRSFTEAAASQIQPVRTEPFLCVFLSNNLDEPRHCLVRQDGPSKIQLVERRKYPGELLPSLVVNSVPGVLIN